MIWISKKSGICLPQVLDLFFLIKELCEQVRDLWSVPHAVSGLAGQADIPRQKCRNPMWRSSFRARIYCFYFLKKVFTPSHSVRFLLIFKGFDCEGLDFKAFTLAVSRSGAKRAAMFYSLACSCRLQGINFFEYISDVINKAAALPPRTPLSKYRELLPDKWKQKNIAQE